MEVSINMTDKELKSKKIRTSSPRRRPNILLIILGIILTAGITTGVYLLYKGYKVSTDIGFQFNPGSVLQPKQNLNLRKIVQRNIQMYS